MVLGDLRQPLLLLLLRAEAACSGSTTPIDWCARQQRRQRRVRTSPPAPARGCSRPATRPRPPYSSGTFMPIAPSALSAVDDVVGDLRVALDLERVDLALEELAQLGEELLALLDRGRVELGLRMDEVEPQVAEEQLLAEARELPLGFACRLGDLACFLLRDVGGHSVQVLLDSAVPATPRVRDDERRGHCATAIPSATSAAPPSAAVRDDLVLQQRPERQRAEGQQHGDERRRDGRQLPQEQRQRDERERGSRRREVERWSLRPRPRTMRRSSARSGPIRRAAARRRRASPSR